METNCFSIQLAETVAISFQLKLFHGMIGYIVFIWEVSSLADEQKTRLAVDIYGQTYTIVGSETSSHVRLVASMVDERMREISSRNPYLDSSKIAVLTAVNSVHDYLKLRERIEQLEEELNKLKG